MDSGELDQTIAQWLDEHQELGATIRQSPSSTIIPEPVEPSNTAQEALEILRQLSGAGTLGGGLEVRDTIGEGGMGVVRVAEQRAMARKVAVKTLRPERRSEAAVMDLLYEGWITGALEHPNVVPVYDMGLDREGQPVIVFKRIEGVQWSELMEDAAEVERRFGESDLLAWNLGILMQVLNAVRFAHSRGILHRDLKPDNVMIGEFGEVYVLDWGIAVSLRDDGSGRMPLAKNVTQMAGTPCYMAPEMLGDQPLSERTDVYLCGAILHEILTGAPPHDGTTAAAVLTSVATSEPILPADAPPHLARICRRAMDRDPHGRFESAEQMRLALRGYLQHRGSQRLAERAERTLSELLSAIGPTRAGADEGEHRQRVYKLFGECRFGFQEALAAWPANPSAAEGLRWAIGAMIEHELAHGDPRTAATLLAELDDAPADLRARIEAALEAQRVDAARRSELEALERDYDSTIGTRTRAFLTGVLGIIWIGLPLAAALGVDTLRFASHRRMAVFSGLLLAFGGGLFVWARESMTKTAINRRLASTSAFMFVTLIVLSLGLDVLGAPTELGGVLYIFVWFLTVGMVTLTVDWRMFPACFGYGVAFLAATARPDLILWLMAGSNGLLTVNGLCVWRPERR